MAAVPTFYVVPGSTVKSVIDEHRKQVFDVVEATFQSSPVCNAIVRLLGTSSAPTQESQKDLTLAAGVVLTPAVGK